MKRVLITGAAGRIGSVLRKGFRDHFPILRLLDIVPIEDIRENEEMVIGDLTDYRSVEACMAGVDAVVHLGGIPDESDFHSILRTNVEGTYNVFEAAKNHGVRRIVFASSIHAVGFYPKGSLIGSDVPARPDTYYGVSKVFGESLGKFYADKYGLDVISVRICSFEERPTDVRHLSTWLSPRDAVQLFLCCLKAQIDSPVVIYGVSANTRSWFDNSPAKLLGYQPVDNAEIYAKEILENALPGNADDPAELFIGGDFVRKEYRGS